MPCFKSAANSPCVRCARATQARKKTKKKKKTRTTAATKIAAAARGHAVRRKKAKQLNVAVDASRLSLPQGSVPAPAASQRSSEISVVSMATRLAKVRKERSDRRFATLSERSPPSTAGE